MSPRESKVDPRYVKVLTRLYGRKNGVKYEKVLQTRFCTEDDIKYFNTPSDEAKQTWDKIMASEDRSLYCFDWDKYGDQIELTGFESSVENYQTLSFDLVPCNYIHTKLGYTGDTIAEGCNANRTAQVEYLSNLKVRIFMSHQAFVQDRFGEETIMRETKFF